MRILISLQLINRFNLRFKTFEWFYQTNFAPIIRPWRVQAAWGISLKMKQNVLEINDLLGKDK